MKRGPQCDNEGVARALDQIGKDDPGASPVHVLHDRLLPGSDCSLAHVVVANHAVTIIRTIPKKGRVKIGRGTIRVGGSNLEIQLAGLNARIETVRHCVGGNIDVFGAIVLARQPKAELKHFGSIPIGSQDAVIAHISNEHSRSEVNPDLAAVAYELEGIFLSPERFEGREAEQEQDAA